ncbi:cell wall hydrolase [Novosphingobium sp.]|uniref:cell wall hydrolase n=1 Tax=Novosphingobium sp. TaxID=1874826 RepID=UPI0025E3A4B7|nr:cell wall hydrolase [Novosphingobium sp.]
MSTSELTLLDLAADARGANRQRSKLERWLMIAIAAMIAALALSFIVPRLTDAAAGGQTAGDNGQADLAQMGPIDAISVDDKAQIMVEGADAQAGNAAIPFLTSPLDQVQAFGLQAAKAETYATALQCLTQAVYYEAAVEPLQGRRAVAQVVLNRVRHPAYPKSVCGVVYQGSQRRTGCQFSFTCDGALLRAPAAGPWREAREVARAALAGYVEPSVGTATFYHADYVLPSWAYKLGKITQIGRHLFYRFNGSWGNAATFNGRYAGIEAIPALDLAALRERALEDGMQLEEAAPAFVPGLTVTPDVTDRHAEADVGGRIDMTKTWRPSIPDPVSGNSHLKQVVATTQTPQSSSNVALRSEGGQVAEPAPAGGTAQ